MLLIPFDAYSDSAHTALTQHKQQHLFAEIEAETNLVFDQVLYSLSERLFTLQSPRRRRPARRMWRDCRPPHDPEATAALGKCWYLPLLSLRHCRILGRSVDLGRLLAQRMNTMIRLSLDLALARFEGKSLDAVIDLHHAIRVTRLTHSYLSAALPDIDSFEACFNQAQTKRDFYPSLRVS